MRGWKRGPDLARNLGTTKHPKITKIARKFIVFVVVAVFVPFAVFTAA